MARREEALSAVTLIRGVIDVGADVPDQDVPLVAAIAQLTVHEDIHPAIEAVLLDAAVLIHSDPSVFTEGGTFPNMSNVDLTQEFTNMIVAQRGFQANGRIITSTDEMLQEVVNLKR